MCVCQVLLCSLYEIYKALEEELDRNCSHPAVVPIYFPQELARLDALEHDLEYFFGPDWRKKVIVPAATHRYTQRIRKVSPFTSCETASAAHWSCLYISVHD